MTQNLRALFRIVHPISNPFIPLLKSPYTNRINASRDLGSYRTHGIAVPQHHIPRSQSGIDRSAWIFNSLFALHTGPGLVQRLHVYIYTRVRCTRDQFGWCKLQKHGPLSIVACFESMWVTRGRCHVPLCFDDRYKALRDVWLLDRD